MPNFIDLKGKRFGRWRVFGEAGRAKFGDVTWRCICDCGNKKIINGDQLRREKSRSCGCLNRETARDRMKGWIGEKNPHWAGNHSGKAGIHRWLRKHTERPAFCKRCKIRPPRDLSYNHHPKTYTRNPDDYEWVCKSCHHFKDKGQVDVRLLTLNRIQRIRELYAAGTGKQKEIARLFSVSTTTIARIIRKEGAYVL